MQHGATVLLHDVDRFAKLRHALPEFALDAAALLFAHLIQSIQHLSNRCQDRGLQRSADSVAGRIERAGNAQDRIEIRFSWHGELRGRRAKRRDVSAHQRTI